jgi:hypothetical protein
MFSGEISAAESLAKGSSAGKIIMDRTRGASVLSSDAYATEKHEQSVTIAAITIPAATQL